MQAKNQVFFMPQMEYFLNCQIEFRTPIRKVYVLDNKAQKSHYMRKY